MLVDNGGDVGMMAEEPVDLCETVMSRFRNSGAPEHKHLCAVVGAMSQVLKDQNLPPSPTAYFAATMSSLERQAAASTDGEDPVTVALCTFLSTVLPRVPQAVLRSKGRASLETLVRILQRNSVSAAAAKAGMSCISFLLAATDKCNWPAVAPSYGILLAHLTDRRPKVRRRAYSCLEEVLRSYQGMPVLIMASEGVGNLFEQFLLKAGGSNSASSIAKGQAVSDGSTGALEVLHILNALKVILPLISGKVISKFLVHFKLLMELRQQFLTRHVMDILHALCISPTAEFSASGLADLLGWFSSSISAEGKSADEVMFIARLLQHGMEKVYALDQSLCAVKLPVVFHSLAEVLAFEHEEAIFGASEALKSLIQNCIDENLIQQGVSRLHIHSDVCKSGPTPIERICTTAESLLGYQYGTAWDMALQVISVMFDKLGESSYSLMGGVIRNLADLQKLSDEDLGCRKQLHKCVGSAVAAMGPEKFLSILPLNLDHEELSEANIWLLPILKQYTIGARLKFFTEHILGLARKLHEKSQILETEGRPVASRNRDACIQSLWMLLPSFCNYPVDTAQNFKLLAKTLGDSLYREPELRGIICSSLQILIQQNKKAQEGNLDALNSLTDGKASEITAAEQRAKFYYTSEVSSENLKILSQFSRNFLSVLFKIFMSSPKDKHGYLQATIGDIASICDRAVVKDFFITAMQKLLKETQDAAKSVEASKSASMLIDSSNAEETPTSIRARLLDLAASLLQGLDMEAVCTLFSATKPSLQDDEGLVQKKAYKVLARILKEHEVFLTSKLDEIFELMVTTMPLCHFSAKRHRLDCLHYLIIHISKAGEEEKNGGIACFLTEIILAVKEPNKKTRARAYDLLVKIGHCLGDVESGGSKENMQRFFNMVVGCLAGSTPHMISAAVTGLARLVYEFSDLCSIVPNLLPSGFVLLQSKSREVIKATLGLMKVVATRLQAEVLQSHLRNMVEGLLLWSDDTKNHFKAKVRIVLEMLVRKCGLDAVKAVMPEHHMKLLTNIRKSKERKEKKKNAVLQDRQGETKSSYSNATTTRKSKWNHTNIFSDFRGGDDNDSDEYTGVTSSDFGNKISVPKSKSSTLRSQKLRKSNKRLPEDSLDLLGSEPLDLLDKHKTRAVLKSQMHKGHRRSDSDDEPELAADGRLVINEEAVGRSRKRRAMNDETEQKIDTKSQQSRQSKSQTTSKSMAKTYQKRQKTSSSGWAYTGAEYTGKKAGGDIKREGKLEPYAYWPLDPKMLNRREEKRAVARKGLSSVMKLTKQLQGKSVRNALSVKAVVQKRKQKSHKGKSNRKSR